jgi:DHA1 family bicyclomycin/chloramphenicol resistance-like MFS transporter
MTPPRASPATIALLLGGLAGLAPFALDTYLPAFPEIAASLGSSRASVQQSLTSYLVPFSAMMLVHGPLSDRYGRRRTILCALLVFCAGSLGCTLAQSIESFLAWRILQGLSAGATTVVGRALVRDLFEGGAAQRAFAQVNMVFMLAPAVAPILGGYLLTLAGWRSIFAFLLLYPLMLLAICWRWLPETLPSQDRTPLQATRIGGNLLALIGKPAFGGLVLMTAAGFCGFFEYVLAAPVFVREVLGLLPTEFAWLFLATVAGSLAGSFCAARLADVQPPGTTIGLGLGLAAVAACANLAYHLALPPAIPWSVLPLTLYCFGYALLLPSATLLILDNSPLPRGATSSLQGFLQIGCAALTSGLLVPVVARSALWLAGAMLGWWLVSALCWLAVRRRALTDSSRKAIASQHPGAVDQGGRRPR